MKAAKLIYSFRVRLLLVLAALLLATLAVQFYLNRRSEQRVARMVAEQEQALAAGFAFAVESLSSTQRLEQLIKQRNLTLLEIEQGRVINILVVTNRGIEDSLDPTYNPQTQDNGSTHYFQPSEALRDLPLVNAGRPNDNNAQQPSPNSSAQPLSQLPATTAATQLSPGAPRAFSFPITTRNSRTDETETTYIVVVLGSTSALRDESVGSALRPLLPTLVVLLLATLATALLVWRFARPISDLSDAARRVAAGDFDFRVPAADRRDEMGALMRGFNDMSAQLGRLRELEARLHQAERSAVVGRLASAIAHEIRNPLNYINLTLDHLRTSYAPQDEQKRETFTRLANQLKVEVARINTRISEFLNYTRPADLELEPLNLRATIDDALRMVEVQAAESNIETRVEQAGDIPDVMGDAESLRSVFTNLIINGLQAIDSQGGKLMVTLHAEEGNVRVDVSDTGGGIAPENISQIFEPYFSTKETGTGLGLAIVKKAIEDHGGAISVTSKQSAGTTFTVLLPKTGEARDQKSEVSKKDVSLTDL